jgi:DNA polymerase II small subunit
VVLASNPATINIHNVSKFPGFDVLLYHGYSLDHYASDVPSLRKGGYDRADQLMEFLLRKRHLAPTHGSTLVNPMAEDFLVIDKVPDIFATAHIHKAKVGKYKHITNVCCSCFQDKTAFQEKVGHTPEPAKVPVINLQTSEVKLMKFRE